MEELLTCWSAYCKEGVSLAQDLYNNGYFIDAIKQDKPLHKIYDEIIEHP